MTASNDTAMAVPRYTPQPYAVVVSSADEPIRVVGPFEDHDDAQRWAELVVRTANGDYAALPLPLEDPATMGFLIGGGVQ